MLEINFEIKKEILFIMDCIKRISESDLNLELPISLLSPRIYMAINNAAIEEWSKAVLSNIFSQTILNEDTLVFSGDVVKELLKKRNISAYEMLVEEAEEAFGYMYEEDEDPEVNLAKEKAFIENFLNNFTVGAVTFKSSLFTHAIKEEFPMLMSIPFFVVSRYSLGNNLFLSADIDDDLNFTIWYLESDKEDFQSSVLSYVDWEDACENLINMFENKFAS